MGIFAEIQGEMFVPEPSAEECMRITKELFQYLEEMEEALWKVDRHEARPIETEEKQSLVKEKCSRAAQRLRARRGADSI